MVAVETRKVMNELRAMLNSRVRYRISFNSKLSIPRQLCCITTQIVAEHNMKGKAIDQLKYNMQVLWDDYMNWKIEFVQPVLARYVREVLSC